MYTFIHTPSAFVEHVWLYLTQSLPLHNYVYSSFIHPSTFAACVWLHLTQCLPLHNPVYSPFIHPSTFVECVLFYFHTIPATTQLCIFSPTLYPLCHCSVRMFAGHMPVLHLHKWHVVHHDPLGLQALPPGLEARVA